MAFAGAASEERQKITEETASEMPCAFLLLINAFPDLDLCSVEKQNALSPEGALPSELIYAAHFFLSGLLHTEPLPHPLTALIGVLQLLLFKHPPFPAALKEPLCQSPWSR